MLCRVNNSRLIVTSRSLIHRMFPLRPPESVQIAGTAVAECLSQGGPGRVSVVCTEPRCALCLELCPYLRSTRGPRNSPLASAGMMNPPRSDTRRSMEPDDQHLAV